jgi:hypothetical protein
MESTPLTWTFAEGGRNIDKIDDPHRVWEVPNRDNVVENLDLNKAINADNEDDYLYDEIECEVVEDESYFALLSKSFSLLANKHTVGSEPKTFREAVEGVEAKEWSASIEELYREMKFQKENQ